MALSSTLIPVFLIAELEIAEFYVRAEIQHFHVYLSISGIVSGERAVGLAW